MHFKSLALTSLAVAAVSAQSSATPTLGDVLQSTPEVSNLTAILGQYPALAGALVNATDITIVAPSNEAFVKFIQGPGRAFANNTRAVEQLLAYHVLDGLVPSSDFSATPAFVPTLLNTPTLTNVTDGQVVEGVVNGTDVEIISGLKQVSKVVKADIPFTGGIIHIIDTVLTIPLKISATAAAAGLTDLVKLLIATNLVSTVDDAKDITVFAPDNAAFNASASTLEKLDAKGVASVLGAHVVPGVVGYSSDLKDGDILKTLSGGIIQITIKDGSIFANGVKIIVPDVLVANGVVHVIGEVLRPPPTNATTGTTGGAAGPSASASGTGPSGATGSPIVPYEKGAASSVKASWTGVAALFVAAGFYLSA